MRGQVITTLLTYSLLVLLQPQDLSLKSIRGWMDERRKEVKLYTTTCVLSKRRRVTIESSTVYPTKRLHGGDVDDDDDEEEMK